MLYLNWWSPTQVQDPTFWTTTSSHLYSSSYFPQRWVSLGVCISENTHRIYTLWCCFILPSFSVRVAPFKFMVTKAFEWNSLHNIIGGFDSSGFLLLYSISTASGTSIGLPKCHFKTLQLHSKSSAASIESLDNNNSSSSFSILVSIWQETSLR